MSCIVGKGNRDSPAMGSALSTWPCGPAGYRSSLDIDLQPVEHLIAGLLVVGVALVVGEDAVLAEGCRAIGGEITGMVWGYCPGARLPGL